MWICYPTPNDERLPLNSELELSSGQLEVLKVIADIKGDTLEDKLIEELENLAENLADGSILGEEIGATYRELLKQDTVQGKKQEQST